MGGKRAGASAEKIERAVDEKADRAGRLEAKERSKPSWEERRRPCLAEVVEFPGDKLVFIDGSGSQRGIQRRLAWTKRGRRGVFECLRNRGTNTTILSAFNLNGIVATICGEGATTQEVFASFLELVLLPELPAGALLVMHNLGVHQAPSVKDLLAARGVRVLPLPPDSPEPNPVEEAWSKLKTFVRSVAPEALRELHRVIVDGLASITSADPRGWFRRAGYAVPARVPDDGPRARAGLQSGPGGGSSRDAASPIGRRWRPLAEDARPRRPIGRRWRSIAGDAGPRRPIGRRWRSIAGDARPPGPIGRKWRPIAGDARPPRPNGRK
jgi:transposase